MSAERPRWDAAFWDERYSSHERVWSGHVNAVLAAEVEGLPPDLTPGRALDVGCGEGGDALWLAERGWSVTGVDVSRVAIERAALRAETVGLGDAVRFEQRDLLTWRPPEAAYDLVSAAFIHLDGDRRREIYAGLSDAVAPGGRFVVLGHHPSDADVVPRPPFPDLFFDADDLAADLEAHAPGQWQVLVAEARPRPGRHPESGADVTLHDTVLHARRTAGREAGG